MIAIIDYEMGNLSSVFKGLEKSGFSAVVTGEPEKLMEAKGLVLPGVGAFADAMEELEKKGLKDTILEAVCSGKPLLGICLGMQLLFNYSEENRKHEGLGLIPGRVTRLPDKVKVPHMGWNSVYIRRRESILFKDIPDGSYFYFVHSYYAVPENDAAISAETDYGLKFASAVEHGNVYGTQFHPEKSSELGLRILYNFGRLVEKC